MRDFQWRKSMDMNVRRARPHGAQYIEIGIAVIGRVNAALKAYISRAAFHRSSRAAADFLKIQTIGRSAHVTGAARGTGAEAANVQADVGIIDVTFEDTGNCVDDTFLQE